MVATGLPRPQGFGGEEHLRQTGCRGEPSKLVGARGGHADEPHQDEGETVGNHEAKVMEDGTSTARLLRPRHRRVGVVVVVACGSWVMQKRVGTLAGETRRRKTPVCQFPRVTTPDGVVDGSGAPGGHRYP